MLLIPDWLTPIKAAILTAIVMSIVWGAWCGRLLDRLRDARHEADELRRNIHGKALPPFVRHAATGYYVRPGGKGAA